MDQTDAAYRFAKAATRKNLTVAETRQRRHETRKTPSLRRSLFFVVLFLGLALICFLDELGAMLLAMLFNACLWVSFAMAAWRREKTEVKNA